jgi:hypothetical protein
MELLSDWQCECGHIYNCFFDDALHCRRFEDLPAGWLCPSCGQDLARKWVRASRPDSYWSQLSLPSLEGGSTRCSGLDTLSEFDDSHQSLDDESVEDTEACSPVYTEDCNLNDEHKDIHELCLPVLVTEGPGARAGGVDLWETPLLSAWSPRNPVHAQRLMAAARAALDNCVGEPSGLIKRKDKWMPEAGTQWEDNPQPEIKVKEHSEDIHEEQIESTQWICPRCTFINQSTWCCSMCSLERPLENRQVEDEESSGSSASDSAVCHLDWTCDNVCEVPLIWHEDVLSCPECTSVVTWPTWCGAEHPICKDGSGHANESDLPFGCESCLVRPGQRAGGGTCGPWWTRTHSRYLHASDALLQEVLCETVHERTGTSCCSMQLS